MKIKFRHILLLILVVLVVAARLSVSIGEWYSTVLFPVISAALSWLVSWIPFSLEEIVAVAAGGLLIGIVVYGIRSHAGFRKTLFRAAEVMMWVYVWIYIGWGCNYFRQNIYTRVAAVRQTYDETVFKDFLHDYTDSLNAVYASLDEDSTGIVPDKDVLERYVKKAYSEIPAEYGLSVPREWQHPKQVLFRNLYSSVGVLGYIGPFFCETQLNPDLLPDQYPFVYAHEYSHLMGVSNEDEANYWAFVICAASDLPGVRFSGYYSLLPYVLSNAGRALSEEDYADLLRSVNPDILARYSQQREYWKSLYSTFMGNLQNTIYNAFLKGNRISSGTASYMEVIDMIISIPSPLSPDASTLKE